MRREVRCCCDPGKLLGSMEVPPEVFGKFTPVPGVTLEVARVLTGIDFVRQLLDPDANVGTVAIKSNDYPIEKLKEIPTFKEA